MNLSEILKSFISVNKEHFELLKAQSKASRLENYEAQDLYDLVHKNSSPVFVLSTGRCGTMLLTKILSTFSGAEVYHEPYPEFIWHNKYAYENHSINPLTVSMIFDAARYEMIRLAFLNNKTYIETNNRITFFAHQIAELYPNAKFIHLIREPVSFVKSGFGRNWYHGKTIYDEGRIIDHTGVERWRKYETIEKIAWLWGTTNDFILDFKSQTTAPIFEISSKQLFNNAEKVQQLLSFINLDSLNIKTLEKLLKKPINSSRSKTHFNEEELEKIESVLTQFKSYHTLENK